MKPIEKSAALFAPQTSTLALMARKPSTLTLMARWSRKASGYALKFNSAGSACAEVGGGFVEREVKGTPSRHPDRHLVRAVEQVTGAYAAWRTVGHERRLCFVGREEDVSLALYLIKRLEE